MNPRRCVIEGTDKPIGWACQCRRFYSDLSFGGAPDAAKAAAEICCLPSKPYVCQECGTENKYAWYGRDAGKPCPACEGARRDRETYEKATKIPWEQYEGEMLFAEDRYESDFDCFDAETEWAFGTKEAKLKLDAGELVQRELENQEWFEEAMDQISKSHFDELQTFLDAWVEKAVPTSYFADESVIVLRPKDDEDEVPHEPDCGCPGCKHDLGCFRP